MFYYLRLIWFKLKIEVKLSQNGDAKTSFYFRGFEPLASLPNIL